MSRLESKVIGFINIIYTMYAATGIFIGLRELSSGPPVNGMEALAIMILNMILWLPLHLPALLGL